MENVVPQRLGFWDALRASMTSPQHRSEELNRAVAANLAYQNQLSQQAGQNRTVRIDPAAPFSSLPLATQEAITKAQNQHMLEQEAEARATAEAAARQPVRPQAGKNPFMNVPTITYGDVQGRPLNSQAARAPDANAAPSTPVTPQEVALSDLLAAQGVGATQPQIAPQGPQEGRIRRSNVQPSVRRSPSSAQLLQQQAALELEQRINQRETEKAMEQYGLYNASPDAVAYQNQNIQDDSRLRAFQHLAKLGLI